MDNNRDSIKNQNVRLWNTLFVFWIGSTLVDQVGKWANSVALQLTGERDLFGSLFWGGSLSLNIIRVLLVTAVIGASLVLYAYLSKEKKYVTYLLMGLSIAFFPVLFFVGVTLYFAIVKNYQVNFNELFKGISLDFYLTLVALHGVAIAYIAKLSRDYGLQLEPLDERDRTSGSVFGIRKLGWVLISFPVTLLVSVGVTAVTRVLRGTFTQLISGKYSGGLEGLVSAVVFPVIAFTIIGWIVSMGVDAIKDNSVSKVFKTGKIILFFIAIPILILWWIGV